MPIRLNIEVTSPLGPNDRDLLSGVAVKATGSETLDERHAPVGSGAGTSFDHPLRLGRPER